MIAVVGVICGVLSGFSASARASDVVIRGDAIADLRNYVQLAEAAQPAATAAENTNQAPTGVARDESADDAYAALRVFTQGIAADPLPSIKDQPKLAEAGSLMEWLQQGGGAPPETPMAPAPRAGKAKAVVGKAPVVAATNVGSKVCYGCHAPVDDTFGYTLMGRLQKQGKLECETCHGPGSAHVKAGGGRGVGGIISFRTDDLSRTAEENNAICLGCHDKGQRIFWPGSVHEERNLSCSNCHTVMRAVSRKYQLKTAFEAETCFQCHKDRRAQMFESSHMPMREGKVVCSDCHSPHGSATEPLLKKASINEVCYTCHAEKRGPFLFEHEPVRENCNNCHDPHGSVNQYSLKLARPRLCTECHNLMEAFAGAYHPHASGQSCENCHVNIHGSNSPSGELFFR
jgi:DmsE family decaheme c-type cytochrome